ncbi:MAG TPA: thiamine pyrophosphate-dependent dehydrogenase E1 component subunit alpha [Longimicrobiales bacterium]|nr:thiamine pyrophosphate-dependent dehydrogenase E1 component subunit alpha [Longimicrobiales bacterium]
MADVTGDAFNGDGETGLSREQLHEIYYYLQLTRQAEEALVNLYRQSKVIGGLYRSLGQEATAVGSAYALHRRTDGTGDFMAPAIRNLGSMFVMGAPVVDVFRQYMAKGNSPTGGRELNVHFTDFGKGYLGPISHLGVMIEVLAGVALSFKLRGEPRVALGYSGDGAASTGAFHEAFNFAAVQRAPLVVIIENNQYAYSTPVSKQTAAESFVARAPAYGVPGESCDGNDVLAVYAMTKRAVERARAGGGASLLEVRTYRRKGHAEHDNQAYVPPEELAYWEAQDPIDRFERQLLARGWATADELAAIRARAAEEVERARTEAEASPLPEPESALDDVYGWPPIRPLWTRLPNPDPHLW